MLFSKFIKNSKASRLEDEKDSLKDNLVFSGISLKEMLVDIYGSENISSSSKTSFDKGKIDAWNKFEDEISQFSNKKKSNNYHLSSTIKDFLNFIKFSLKTPSRSMGIVAAFSFLIIVYVSNFSLLEKNQEGDLGVNKIIAQDGFSSFSDSSMKGVHLAKRRDYLLNTRNLDFRSASSGSNKNRPFNSRQLNSTFVSNTPFRDSVKTYSHSQLLSQEALSAYRNSNNFYNLMNNDMLNNDADDVTATENPELVVPAADLSDDLSGDLSGDLYFVVNE